MSILMMAKILTNLSLYYAFISIFRGNGTLLPILLSVIFCMAGIGTATRWNKKLISFLLLAFPFLYLIPLSKAGIGTVIMCLVPTVYCIILIFMGNLRVDYNRFETHLRVSAIVFLIFFAMTALLNGSWQTAAAFTILYLYTGTWLLRQLRLQESSDTRIRILDAFISAGILLVVYLAGGFLLFLLGYASNFLSVLWIPLEAILYTLAWIFYTLVSLLPSIPIELPESQMEMESMAAGEAGVIQSGTSSDGSVIKIILILIGAVILLTITIRLIRKFRYRELPETPEAKSIRREKIAPPQRARRLRGKDSRTTLRKIYRKYLKQLKAEGLKTSPGMTSNDIQHAAEEIHKGIGKEHAEGRIADGNPNTLLRDATASPDALLRGLYLPARYSPGYESTDQEVQEAKKLSN